MAEGKGSFYARAQQFTCPNPLRKEAISLTTKYRVLKRRKTDGISRYAVNNQAPMDTPHATNSMNSDSFELNDSSSLTPLQQSVSHPPVYFESPRSDDTFDHETAAECHSTNVTGFWKTDHFITFDIINNSVYLGHSKWYYWFNKCLHQSQIT